MGALEMQNLSVLDNRAFLLNHLDVSRRLSEGPARRELSAILGESQDGNVAAPDPSIADKPK